MCACVPISDGWQLRRVRKTKKKTKNAEGEPHTLQKTATTEYTLCPSFPSGATTTVVVHTRCHQVVPKRVIFIFVKNIRENDGVHVKTMTSFLRMSNRRGYGFPPWLLPPSTRKGRLWPHRCCARTVLRGNVAISTKILCVNKGGYLVFESIVGSDSYYICPPVTPEGDRGFAP